jgi:hypothetical protein
MSLGQSEEDEDKADEAHSQLNGIASFTSFLEPSGSNIAIPSPAPAPSDLVVSEPARKKGKRKRKHRPTPSGPKPSRWADKCMYAELLEMSPEGSWTCGLPQDLETGWVAVGPVPAGKRCLAVTHQSAGVAGVGMLLSSSPGGTAVHDLAQTQKSPKHDTALTSARQVSDPSIPILAPPFHDPRLHPRRELARQWYSTRVGLHQVEGARRRRL